MAGIAGIGLLELETNLQLGQKSCGDKRKARSPASGASPKVRSSFFGPAQVKGPDDRPSTGESKVWVCIPIMVQFQPVWVCITSLPH